MNQILKRQTSPFHYGSKFPAVTITVFITILEQNRQNSCHNSTKLSEVNVKNIFTSHIDKKIFLTFLFLTTYLYTFSLYENPSFIILPKGQQKTDNTEKPVALGTHDEEKQNINTTQHVSNTTIRRQTHITDLRHQPPTNNDRTSETATDITTRNPKRKETK